MLLINMPQRKPSSMEYLGKKDRMKTHSKGVKPEAIARKTLAREKYLKEGTMNFEEFKRRQNNF